MQIVLHIGMHKTGTTSVQQWLRDHQKKLREQGIEVFPLDTRVVVPRTDLFDPEDLQVHLQRLKVLGIKRVIISHEVLSTLCKTHVRMLRQTLQPFPVRVVVVFRHWINFLPSRWRQNSKRRDGQSFGRYLERICDAPERFDMNFHKILENFSPRPDDEIVVVPFERAEQEGGVVRQVLLSAGLSHPTLVELGENMATLGAGYHLNSSTYSQDIEMLRIVNGCYARFRGWDDSEMFIAFGQGRLFRELFDLERVCRMLENEKPDLWEFLLKELNKTWRSTLLFQSDFGSQERFLEEAASAYKKSSPGWQKGMSMFPALPTREVRWADIEAENLPDALVSEIAQSVVQVGKKLNWRPKFPASLARDESAAI